MNYIYELMNDFPCYNIITFIQIKCAWVHDDLMKDISGKEIPLGRIYYLIAYKFSLKHFFYVCTQISHSDQWNNNKTQSSILESYAFRITICILFLACGVNYLLNIFLVILYV